MPAFARVEVNLTLNSGREVHWRWGEEKLDLPVLTPPTTAEAEKNAAVVLARTYDMARGYISEHPERFARRPKIHTRVGDVRGARDCEIIVVGSWNFEAACQLAALAALDRCTVEFVTS